MTEFRQTLMTLPSPITSENEDFIISKYPLFEDAKSIESIFVYLNFYLSFIDFSLLEHIIEQFGSDSLKRDMSSYAKDMRHFRMNTPVSEALDHLPRNSDLPAGYSRLKAKFAYNVQTATLEDVDTYRKGLAKRCLLSPLVLSLFDLQESSLLVTWLVPAAVGAMISDQVQKKTASFFLSNSILKLSLEGECLYSFMPMVKDVFNFAPNPIIFISIQANTGESSSPMIEAGAGLTSLEPHQRIADEIKQTIDLRPYYRGLAIVVQYFLSLFHITAVLTRKLRFTVYQPQHKPSLKSYMQAVDLVELKHHPIIVVVSGDGVWGNHLFTDIGDINIKEDIMAPLFPPIATHLADNPKIFLFMIRSSSSERYSALHFMEPISENYIVGYIACDNSDDIRRAGDIVQDKLAHPSMSVQEIFTSISDELPPHTTMTVIDRLKGPVYLHPRGPELIETHSESQGIVTCL